MDGIEVEDRIVSSEGYDQVSSTVLPSDSLFFLHDS